MSSDNCHVPFAWCYIVCRRVLLHTEKRAQIIAVLLEALARNYVLFYIEWHYEMMMEELMEELATEVSHEEDKRKFKVRGKKLMLQTHAAYRLYPA